MDRSSQRPHATVDYDLAADRIDGFVRREEDDGLGDAVGLDVLLDGLQVSLAEAEFTIEGFLLLQ